MRKYQKFEDSPAWQESARLYQRILDVVEEPNVPLSATFRNQLERAALCVSTTVAESFDWISTGELISLLSGAKAAAVEVQSMMALISERPKVARLRPALQDIRASAEICTRQLGAWKHAIENPNPSKRPPLDDQTSASRASTNPVASGPKLARG